MLRFRLVAIALLVFFALGIASYFLYKSQLDNKTPQPNDMVSISSPFVNRDIVPLPMVGVSTPVDIDSNQKVVRVAGKIASFKLNSDGKYVLSLEIPSGTTVKTVNVNLGDKDNIISELKRDLTSTDDRVKYLRNVYQNITVEELFLKNSSTSGKIAEVQLLAFANVAELSKAGCNSSCKEKIVDYEKYKSANLEIVNIHKEADATFEVGSVVTFYLSP